MSQSGILGIDLFKIAGESIAGWIPSWKMGGQKPTRQPFCRSMVKALESVATLYVEAKVALISPRPYQTTWG